MNSDAVTILHKVLCEHVFPVILEMAGHVVILCLTPQGTAQLFSGAAIPFYTPVSSV